MYESAIWCTATNLFCLFPTVEAYRRKLPEWTLYMGTGIASVLYHIHHYNKYTKPMCSFLDYRAIRHVDLVMSDLSVCCAAARLIDKDMLQYAVVLSVLPFEMYAVYVQSEITRLVFTVGWAAVSILYVLTHRSAYNLKWFGCGVGANVIELSFYAYLARRYPWHYNWLHAIHHIFGFLSIYFYARAGEQGVGGVHHRRIASHDFNI